MTAEFSATERFHLYALFFYFGMGVMAIAPRTPDLKHNLGLSNGTFGTLLSMGSVGSVVALLIMGRIAHRFGARPIMVLGSTTMLLPIAIMPFLHAGWLYLLLNIITGFGVSTFHISINGQTIHRQNQTGLLLLPRLHGTWCVGAFATALLAFFITPCLSLARHITSLEIILWILIMISIRRLQPTLIGPTHEADFSPQITPRAILRAFNNHRLIAIAQLFAVQIEFSDNDWATLFARQQLHMSAALSTLPYLVFVGGMISLRLTVNKFITKRAEEYWLTLFPIVGGTLFSIFLIIGPVVARTNAYLGFFISLVGFLAGGMGCSFMMPLLYDLAARFSNLPGSVIIAELGLINAILVFVAKIIISWVAQATSISIALLIPGLLLILTSTVARVGKGQTHTL
mgnify:CR=1 FL=1